MADEGDNSNAQQTGPGGEALDKLINSAEPLTAEQLLAANQAQPSSAASAGPSSGENLTPQVLNRAAILSKPVIQDTHSQDDLSLADIDELLADEDPGFAGRTQDIALRRDLNVDIEITPLDVEAVLDRTRSSPEPSIGEENQEVQNTSILAAILKGFSKVDSKKAQGTAKPGEKTAVVEAAPRVQLPLKPVEPVKPKIKTTFKVRIKALPKNSISVVKASLVVLMGLCKRIWSSPRKLKLIWLSVLILVLTTVFTAKLTLRGGYLPSFRTKFLSSFDPLADKKFEFNAEEPQEEFNSPLRHPEYVVELDQIVVNLKRSDRSRNPMGLFQFYIEAATKEGAIEINQRQKEVVDTVSRTLERVRYEDAVTAEGKEKLKLNLRKEINQILTHGRVRRVLFKSIVLKP